MSWRREQDRRGDGVDEILRAKGYRQRDGAANSGSRSFFDSEVAGVVVLFVSFGDWIWVGEAHGNDHGLKLF